MVLQHGCSCIITFGTGFRALGHEQGRVEESPSGQLGTQSVAGSSGGAPGRRTSSRWASLIARIYDVLPLVCPSCGASMSIIAFITDPVPEIRVNGKVEFKRIHKKAEKEKFLYGL